MHKLSHAKDSTHDYSEFHFLYYKRCGAIFFKDHPLTPNFDSKSQTDPPGTLNPNTQHHPPNLTNPQPSNSFMQNKPNPTLSSKISKEEQTTPANANHPHMTQIRTQNKNTNKTNN
ncbi:MAG: hypothetical protein LBQ98_02735 [Nitrososphaerota archaeon]|nr:hypothetical protein [Nitrososphaerota archaeon]